MFWFIVTLYGKEVYRVKAKDARAAKREAQRDLRAAGWVSVAVAKIKIHAVQGGMV